MESPERHAFGSSMEGQESPLFSFLFTLSPIKPIKSLHVSQSFTELSFPPPPPVFVTPRVHVKSSIHRNSYKSKQSASPSHSNSIQNNMKEDVSYMDQQSTQYQDNSDGLLCTSPSKLVETQLAERVEAESNTTCSAVSTSVCDSNGRRCSPVDVLTEGDMDQRNSLSKEGTIASSGILLKLVDSDKKEEHMGSLMGNPDTLQDGQPLEPLSVVDLCSPGTINNSEALDTNKDAADLVHMLSQVAEKAAHLHDKLEGGQNVVSSALLETVNQHTSDCLLSFYGNVNKRALGRQSDSSLMQMPTDCGDVKNTNAFREQQEGDANKVNFPVQRGFRRRCLDFRVSDDHWKGKGMTLLKSMQSSSYSKSQSSTIHPSDQDIHLTILNERTLATSDASDSMPAKPRLLHGHFMKDDPVDLDDQLHGTCSPYGIAPSPPNILSGIGLHLNSLTGSMPLLQSLRGGNVSSALVNFSSAVVGTKSQSQIQLADKHGAFPPLANFENRVQPEAVFEGDLIASVAEKTELVACKDNVIRSSESVACVGLDTTRTKQLKDYQSSTAQTRLSSHLDQETVLLPVERCQTDFDGGQDSCTTQSGRNTRKRALTADSFGDGCKRCNCKKSKCLKLYCECFAAGLFCIDSCSCYDCHNKPSYEAMVLETRQQIQSRNPLAFAPKIMRTVAESPRIGEKTVDVTPASARHKRGCSCKKSKCLKKYCECYQESVGCSEDCRCENCENLYGRKEGSEGSDGKDIIEELNGKEVINEKINTSSFCSEISHAAQYRQDDLTPITPSFQHAGSINSSTNEQSTKRRRSSSKGLQSPDSLLPSSKPFKTVRQLPRSSKAAQNNFEVYKTSRQPPSSPGCSPKSFRSDQFSPRWDGLGDICTLTPLPQAPLRPTTPSASFIYGTESSPSLNVPQCGSHPGSCGDSIRNGLLAQCTSPVICHQASESSTTNCRACTPTDLQGMPNTPIANAPFCGMGLESPYEDAMFFCTEVAGSSGEDAIPAILKGPEPARSSMFSLKSSSPKQKRVSPPHFVGSRITSQGKWQSPALRNGRKFTLQAVSSGPTSTFSAIEN